MHILEYMRVSHSTCKVKRQTRESAKTVCLSVGQPLPHFRGPQRARARLVMMLGNRTLHHVFRTFCAARVPFPPTSDRTNFKRAEDACNFLNSNTHVGRSSRASTLLCHSTRQDWTVDQIISYVGPKINSTTTVRFALTFFGRYILVLCSCCSTRNFSIAFVNRKSYYPNSLGSRPSSALVLLLGIIWLFFYSPICRKRCGFVLMLISSKTDGRVKFVF